jgi:hypothetical protein
MSNHHAQESQRLISADNGWTIGYESADAQHIVGQLEANTQATLALAYEQRTANLIALAQMEHRNSAGIGFHEDYDSATIQERLGME